MDRETPTAKYFRSGKIGEIFDFYDYPRLFELKTFDGESWMSLNVDENDTSSTWMYWRVSAPRFERLCSGGIDLRDSIIQAEDMVVYVMLHETKGKDILKVAEAAKAPETYLPEPGWLLSKEGESDA